MTSITPRDENHNNSPGVSLKSSPTGKPMDFSAPPKRATTVHLTSPASRARWTSRPQSYNGNLEGEAQKPLQTLPPPSYFRKPRLQQPVLDSKNAAATPRLAANIAAGVEKPLNSNKPVIINRSNVGDRMDPFVMYHSDSSFSVDSSSADEHSIRSLPALRPGSANVPITPSLAALQNPAAAAAALAAANARPRDPQVYRRTASFNTSKRARPASVTVMTSTPATITEDTNSRPRTPEEKLEAPPLPYSVARQPSHVPSSLDPSEENLTDTPTLEVSQIPVPTPQRPRHVSSPLNLSLEDLPDRPVFEASQTPYSTPRRPRHVSSPLNLSTEKLPSTPPSLVRRLSRRLSTTSRDFLISNNSTPNHSQATLPSFPETAPIPLTAAPSFPDLEQLASLNRRHSSNETLTPPRMRARSNTAPRAASGARRYVLFPDFMDGEKINDLAEGVEEDAVVEEPAGAAKPTILSEPVIVAEPAVMTEPEAVVEDTTLISTSPAQEAVDQAAATPTTSLKRRAKLQARLSGVRSRLSSGGLMGGAKAANTEKAEGEGAKCVVM